MELISPTSTCTNPVTRPVSGGSPAPTPAPTPIAPPPGSNCWVAPTFDRAPEDYIVTAPAAEVYANPMEPYSDRGCRSDDPGIVYGGARVTVTALSGNYSFIRQDRGEDGWVRSSVLSPALTLDCDIEPSQCVSVRLRRINASRADVYSSPRVGDEGCESPTGERLNRDLLVVVLNETATYYLIEQGWVRKDETAPPHPEFQTRMLDGFDAMTAARRAELIGIRNDLVRRYGTSDGGSPPTWTLDHDDVAEALRYLAALDIYELERAFVWNNFSWGQVGVRMFGDNQKTHDDLGAYVIREHGANELVENRDSNGPGNTSLHTVAMFTEDHHGPLADMTLAEAADFIWNKEVDDSSCLTARRCPNIGDVESSIRTSILFREYKADLGFADFARDWPRLMLAGSDCPNRIVDPHDAERRKIRFLPTPIWVYPGFDLRPCALN